MNRPAKIINGWYRLWILVSAIYGVVVLGFALVASSGIKATGDASALPYLKPATAEMIRPAFDEFDRRKAKIRYWTQDEIDALNQFKAALFEFPTIEGVEVHTPRALPEDLKLTVSSELYHAAKKARSMQWLQITGTALALWLLPAFAVLLLGRGIAWVICGFRARKPN